MVTTTGKLSVGLFCCVWGFFVLLWVWFFFFQNKERGHNNVTKEELESCMINQVTFVLYHTYRCTIGLGLYGKIGRKNRLYYQVESRISKFRKQ